MMSPDDLKERNIVVVYKKNLKNMFARNVFCDNFLR